MERLQPQADMADSLGEFFKLDEDSIATRLISSVRVYVRVCVFVSVCECVCVLRFNSAKAR